MKHLKVSANDLLTYAYDGAGNRVQQTKTHMLSDEIEYERLHDYYVRDNSGNILAILNYREHLTQKWNPHEPLSEIYGNLGVTPYSVATIYANDANFMEGVIGHIVSNESVASSMINAWEATDYFDIKHAYKWDRCLQRRNEALQEMYQDVSVLPIVALALRTQAPSALGNHFFSNPERAEIAIALWTESEGSTYNNFLGEMNAADGAELLNLYEEDPVSFKERLVVFLNELGEDTEYQFIAKWLMDTELNHPDIGSEQGQWWDMQWQALDLRLSDPNFGTEAPLVDEYFANQDGALDLLRVDAGDATLLRTQYLADQNSFLNDYITELGDEAVGIALKNVPGLTAAKLLKTVTGDLPEPTLAGYYEEYLLGESFHLAEHHFYGNKRLGIKYYWPATGWGWDATTGYIPYLNTWITSRVPWYSRAMNEFIQPDITEPRYNKLDYSSWFSSRLLGTKRFELTDHLGNVSSVILDRKTPVNTGSVLHKYDPDVQLVLDYYPYGMVMKEGYCDTCDPNAVTQSTGPALKMVNTDYTLLPQNYPPLTGTTVANWTVVTGGEAEPQEEGQLSWEGTGGGMLFTCLNEVNPGTHELGMTALMEVTAEESHEIEVIVDIDDAGELEAKIISYTDPEHTEYDVLTSTELPTSTGYLLQFTPTTDTVWLWIGRKAEHGFVTGTKFKVTGTTTAKTTWTVYQMNIQGLLHSWRSPYRFAYNGQERVDDIKGKTNHNTALYGEYDTRRAWRWNRDPKPVFGISPYVMFQGNPICNSDVLLDSAWYKSNDGGLHFDGRINSQKDMKKLGIKGTYIGEEAYGQTKGKDATGLYGDRKGRLSCKRPLKSSSSKV